MVKLTAVSPVEKFSNPEAAVLVDESGHLATADRSAGAARWYIAAEAPAEAFVQFLVGNDAAAAAVVPLEMKGRGSGLLFGLQLGAWQYRVVLPLLGPTVQAYLQGMQEQGGHVTVELFAPDLARQARRFEIPMAAEQVDAALRGLRLFGNAEHGDVRREIATLCMSAAQSRHLPPAGGWSQNSSMTLARVYPPELLPEQSRGGFKGGMPSSKW